MEMLRQGNIRIKNGKIGLPESANQDQQQGDEVENRVFEDHFLFYFVKSLTVIIVQIVNNDLFRRSTIDFEQPGLFQYLRA